MSLRKSTSLIEGVGENRKLFSNTFIYDGDKIFWLILTTKSETKDPLIRPLHVIHLLYIPYKTVGDRERERERMEWIFLEHVGGM